MGSIILYVSEEIESSFPISCFSNSVSLRETDLSFGLQELNSLSSKFFEGQLQFHVRKSLEMTLYSRKKYQILAAL